MRMYNELIQPVVSRAPNVLFEHVGGSLGYLYPSQENALSRMSEICKQNPLGIILLDIDDTLCPTAEETMGGLNLTLKKNDEQFKTPHLKDLRETPVGRYFQIPSYAQAGNDIEGGFKSIIKPYLTSETFHAGMMYRVNAKTAIEKLRMSNFAIAGYVSGRPTELTQVTAKWLKYYRFPESPVFCMNADPRFPSNEKPAYIKTVLLPVIRNLTNAPIYLVDDDIPTSLALATDTDCKNNHVFPVVPIIGRNSGDSQLQILDKNGILHGQYSQELITEITMHAQTQLHHLL
jgi:hypothetical protein